MHLSETTVISDEALTFSVQQAAQHLMTQGAEEPTGWPNPDDDTVFTG